MIDLKKIPHVKENIEFLKSQLTLFKNRLESEEKIEPNDNTVEEEKARLMALIDSHTAKLPNILKQIEDINSRNDLKNIKMGDQLIRLQTIDETLYQIKDDIEIIVKEQFNCGLENYKRELLKASFSILEQFDFITPNIRYDITYLEKFYRIPSNAANTILPELEELVSNLENHKITLKEFLYGYKYGKTVVDGFNSLRVKNNVLSRYQFYENSADDYDKINQCILNICRAISPFLSEQRTEPDFAKLFTRIEEINRVASNRKLGVNIRGMKDVFEYNYIFKTLLRKVGKKYSYRDEYKAVKEKIAEFNEMQKAIVRYFDEEIDKQQGKLAKFFTDESQKNMFERIIEDVKRYMEEKSLSFERIDRVFKKLLKKDFNIVVQEKEADDLTIQVTPHLGKKFGEDNLKRINIIILEIDFWFPYEAKQLLFEELSKITQKIQADEPIDSKEFIGMVKDYNKEIDEKHRKRYELQIKLVNSLVKGISEMFRTKRDRDKLNKRLMEKEAWEDMSGRATKVRRSLAVLSSNHESLKSNINKFPFLKGALEEICQLLYDYSMQLFITYELADQRSIINMTNILSTYNEYHDVKSLWQAFNHYYKSNAISNFYANERKMMRLTQNFNCKTELNKLFPT